MSSRSIRLRRPATLSIQEGIFVPEAKPGLMNEIDRRWNSLCESNSAYFDGRLYHVLGVHRNGHGGATLHVIDCAYRFHAVQNESLDVGMRALGLKGIVQRQDKYLMGRRSARVAAYKNLWEFAPGGSMEPGKQPAALLQQELFEETGLRSVQEPTPIAVLYDPVLRCWELVYRLATTDDASAPRSSEYSELQWRRGNDLPAELSPVARQIAALLAPGESIRNS